MNEGAIRARVESARSGDPEAFGELFRAFRADVERLCSRMLGSSDEAEDAAAEAFLRAQRSLDGYDPEQPFRRWLLSIAAHHCVDRLRRRTAERRLFSEERGGDDLAASGPSPLQHRLTAEARGVVQSAIDALPDRYRAPVVLRYYADLDYDAIGDALGVTRNQVATLLFRAKRRLREELARRDERL